MVEPTLLRPFLAPAKSDVARSRLLEAGLGIFSEKGLKGATVREIARAAGQNVAAIAYYFGSKEQLYRAIVEGIAREIRRRMADVVEQIDALRQQTRPKPAEAIRLLKQALRGIYLRLTSRTDTLPIGRLIVREQTQPSAEFEILYREVFRELHERLSFLVGTVLHEDPAHERVIIRTHALIGQLWFFAIARETILRRLSWHDLEGVNAELVAGLVEEHIDILLSGLVARRKARVKSSSS
jgi:AcrR family transcriptional regulator